MSDTRYYYYSIDSIDNNLPQIDVYITVNRTGKHLELCAGRSWQAYIFFAPLLFSLPFPFLCFVLFVSPLSCFFLVFCLVFGV